MIEINLLSKDKRDNKRKTIPSLEVSINPKVPLIIAVFVIEIVALGVVSYMLNRKVSVLQEKYSRLSKLEQKVRSMNIKIAEVNRMIRTVKKLEKGRGKAALILEQIADSIPQGSFLVDNNAVSSVVDGGLWLTKMIKKGNIIVVDGESFSAEAVADYMMRLESLKDVNTVRFSGGGLRQVLSKNGVNVYDFSITVTLKD